MSAHECGRPRISDQRFVARDARSRTAADERTRPVKPSIGGSDASKRARSCSFLRRPGCGARPDKCVLDVEASGCVPAATTSRPPKRPAVAEDEEKIRRSRGSAGAAHVSSMSSCCSGILRRTWCGAIRPPTTRSRRHAGTTSSHQRGHSTPDHPTVDRCQIARERHDDVRRAVHRVEVSIPFVRCHPGLGVARARALC